MNYLLFSLIVFISIYFIVKCNYKRIIFLSKEHTIAIKGLAIILVVLCHIGGASGMRYFTPLGGIGVSIFLIVSGYGLSLSYEKNGLEQYWSKKITAVLIPYMIIEIISICFRGSSTLRTILLDLFIVGSKHPYGWYMKCLLFWYATFYIIMKLNITSKSKLYLLNIISIIMLFNKNELWAEQAFSFYIGVILAYNRSEIINMIEKNRVMPHLLLFIGILFLAIKQISIVRMSPYYVLNIVQLFIKLNIAFALIIYMYTYSNIIKVEMLSKVGYISYSLYLIHGYTINLLLNITYTKIVIFLILSFGLSIIYERYVVKNIPKYFNVKPVLNT